MPAPLAQLVVTKVTNKFVEQMVLFLKLRTYVVDPCLCMVHTYYAEYLMVTLLADCLTYEQQCAIIKKANTYPDPVDNTVTTTECESSTPVKLKVTGPNTCTFTARPKNSLDQSGYAEVFTTDNSQYVNIRSNVVLENNCGQPVQSIPITGGCVLADCQDAYKGFVQYEVGMIENVHGSNAVANDAYFQALKVYKTDANGDLDPTPIILDLNPASSPYYAAGVSCPGCTALTLAQVKFGHVNFIANFSTLMDNVSLALFGVTGKHLMSASIGGIPKRVSVVTKALHNPSGTWFGVHAPDMYVRVYNTLSTSAHVQTTRTKISIYGVKLRRQVTFNTACGSMSPTIKTTTSDTKWFVNTSLTSFNSIVPSTPYSEQPLFGVSDTVESCHTWLLTATYPNDIVDHVQWLNPGNVEISTTNTAVVTAFGTYTFKLFTTTGCVITKTITISDLTQQNENTPDDDFEVS